MPVGSRCAGQVIVPGIGGEIVIQIILVSAAVPVIGTAPGNYLHLSACRAVEVGGLAGTVDFKLFHAVGRGRQDSRWPTCHCKTLIGDASGRVAGETRRVDAHAAVHVVGVVATIEHEAALIHDRTSNTAVRTHAWLQLNKGADVAVKAGQRVQSDTADGVAHRGIRGLQFSAGCLDLHYHIRAPNLERGIKDGRNSDLYDLVENLG